ncbi:hypothetical protein niasHS_013049 [Heterodera schachtii]|uniref:Uncharacterized protein n=1 Tax=Heterodera schachtii TaxID=97005 RepID=A0ABD2I6H6_HETSC
MSQFSTIIFLASLLVVQGLKFEGGISTECTEVFESPPAPSQYDRLAPFCVEGSVNSLGIEDRFSKKKCDALLGEFYCYFLDCEKDGHKEWGCTVLHGPEHCNAINKRFNARCKCSYGEKNEVMPFPFPPEYYLAEESDESNSSE